MCKLSPKECNLSKLPAVGASRESSWTLHWISKATTEAVPQLHYPKVGLFNPNSGSPWQPTILSLSLGLCLVDTPCPDCRTEGSGSRPPCPLQTGTDYLVANIKLSLGFTCLLPGKFIWGQTDFPIFKWCGVGLSNYDPEHFFPYPLTCNLKINTQAPRGCDNFSKQNWK